MNTLIADDDDITRLLLGSALTKLGHDVHEATNGREAWAAWQSGEFPLIISDWMMPDLDGLEFCRRVRAEERTDYTYIVLLTSRSGKTDYLEAMNAGADDFITKPFEKEEFAARVRVAERILEFTTQIRLLKELIPICMFCKRIRDDSDYWQQVESYIHACTGSSFSHGICPECFDHHMAKLPSRSGVTVAPAPVAAA